MRQLRSIPTFQSLFLRDYRLLWLGQVTTSLGQWMDQTARGWLIYHITNSPLQLGLVSAARGLPLLLFGAIAGVAADRYGRKAQLIIAQVTNAILNGILAALILTGRIEIWHVYVTAFLAGTVQAFQQPARQVLINDLVGPDHLMNAIALNSTALNLSRSVGPAICGLIIQASGVGQSYVVQAIFYAAATLWTMQIRVPKRTPEQDSYRAASTNVSFFASLKEGFVYIGQHRLILALMILGLAPILLGMPYQSLLPIYAKDILHGGAETQGLMLTGMGIGAIVGGLTIASLGRKQGNGKLLIAGAAGFGVSLILFSRSTSLQMAMAFTFLAGLSNTSYASQDQTIIQTIAAPEVRGRVLGVYLLNRGLMPVGALLAGWLASLWVDPAAGGRGAVLIMGTTCFLLAIVVALAAPDIWKSRMIPGRQEQQPEKAPRTG